MSERTPNDIRRELVCQGAVTLDSDTVLLNRACKRIAALERQRAALLEAAQAEGEHLFPSQDDGASVFVFHDDGGPGTPLERAARAAQRGQCVALKNFTWPAEDEGGGGE